MMKRNYLLLLFISSFFVFHTPALLSQNISGTVLNKETSDPIGDVFVFLDNSSVGTVTDKKGYFSLSVNDASGVDLVFSHLNFKLQTFRINAGADSIVRKFHLLPTSNVLEEVVVTTKSKPRLKVRWVRRFKDAFLGDVSDKMVILQNPEVLLFEKDKEGLHAKASQPLIITNKILGYEIRFFLSHFLLGKENDTDYKGKAFFKALTGSKREVAKFKRNRQKIYKKSSRKFFTDILVKEFSALDYKVGYSSVDESNNTFTEFKGTDSLTIKATKNAHFEIHAPGYLTIIDLNTIDKQKNISKNQGDLGTQLFAGVDVQKAISYIHPKTYKISVNQYGRILNPLDIEEFGYWATLRVGTLLPFDYEQPSNNK